MGQISGVVFDRYRQVIYHPHFVFLWKTGGPSSAHLLFEESAAT